jgi:outer membrane protein assembly factor BamB
VDALGRPRGFIPTVERTSETLYVGGAGVHALDPVSGERRWSFTSDADGVDVHASRTIFASAGRNGVWALDPGSGGVRWTFDPEREVVGPATAGTLAVVGVGGTVSALDGRPSQ